MIYLDNAATSFPKPRRVWEEQERCMRTYCGNPGRGSHALAMRAAEKIYDCRAMAAEFFDVPAPERVIFTLNTTSALNMAIKGLLRTGDHVLLSDMEHNAVFRPVYKLAREGKITYDIFRTPLSVKGLTKEAFCAGIEERIRPDTRMLVCAHASNLCGVSLPLGAIGAVCKKHGIFFVVDAAQSAGILPIRMQKDGIDALCVPGHKGLWGPQGCGMLMLGETVSADTLIEGGSGYQSLDGNMPADPPERYEAGTLPTPAIAGLLEGIRAVREIGTEQIFAHEAGLCRELRDALSEMPGVRIYVPEAVGSALLFSLEGVPSDVVGSELDRLGFCVRAGYHCAALAHASLKTPAGGAVRVSPGWRATEREMRSFRDAVAKLCRELQPENP